MQLKYGTNPHQRYAAVEPVTSGTQPIEVLHGTPSLINFLDALNAWQLVRELRGCLGLPAATSFKHVSPAGAAVAAPLGDELRKVYEVEGRDLSPAALAYVRARGADPKSSFGDFVALSDRVDRETAEFLKGVVSDGIVAPGYDPAALEILKAKKSGGFIVMRADPDYQPPPRESREIFGVRLTQDRNDHVIGRTDLANVKIGALTDDATRDLLLGLVTLKYTQSNSVGYAWGGQMIGIGAGQQSRVDCTKLAGAKVDTWWLRRHPKVRALPFVDEVRRQERINWEIRYIEGDMDRRELERFRSALGDGAPALRPDERQAWLGRLDDVALASDGYIPFRDNIDQAARHGVRYIADPGGSARNDEVEAACAEHDIVITTTGIRLFLH